MNRDGACEKNRQAVRLLFDRKEKQVTRPLYEQAFGDGAAYVDYYYREKCRDNVIAVKTEAPADTLLSMAHLNPYLFSVCGAIVRSYMVAAVATDAGRRREGHMRDVLQAAFAFMAEQGVPFAVLLPVDPAIYAPFGFETVCAFTEKEPAQKTLAERYDIYTVRDLAAKRRRAMEQALDEAGSEDEGWPADPVIMARVTDAAAFDAMAGRSFQNDAERLAWLKSKRICISDGV